MAGDMRKALSAILAFFLAAAVPLVPLLFEGEPDSRSGEYLLPSEAAILFYPISVAIGAVVGILVFLAIRLGCRPFWRCLTLTGLVVGAAGLLLVWFGTQEGHPIWILPLGLLSTLSFGAVYRLAKGR
jgi:VIT1/CCC1 family predicted Fe2+/Mn2+ transporter